MAKNWLKRVLKPHPHGTDEQFDRIFNDYVELIHLFITKRINHEKDAEAITLKVFERVNPHIGTFETSKHLKDWLYKTARNACANYLKSQAIQKKHLRYVDPQDDLEHLDNPDGSVEDIENEIEYEYNLPVIMQEIDKLSPRKRSIFLLHHRDGHSIKAIATQLNIKLNTAKTYLKEAMDTLRTNLSDKDLILLLVILCIESLIS